MIGNQLFSGKFNNNSSDSVRIGQNLYNNSSGSIRIRQNFDGFYNSFLVAFQLLTVENWNDVLTIALVSDSGAVLSCLYLISWIFLGNYVLLNLFLSILLSGFSKIKEIEEDENIVEIDDFRVIEEKRKKLEEDKEEKRLFHSDIEDFEEEFLKKSSNLMKKPLFSGISCEQSLYFLKKNSFFRVVLYRIVRSSLFENFILLMIIISSMKLALDTYFISDSADSAQIVASNAIDYVFNVIFICECLTKVLSFGFVVDEGSYLRENWNVMDFFIVMSSLIDMSLPNIDLPFIKVFKFYQNFSFLRKFAIFEKKIKREFFVNFLFFTKN